AGTTHPAELNLPPSSGQGADPVADAAVLDEAAVADGHGAVEPAVLGGAGLEEWRRAEVVALRADLVPVLEVPDQRDDLVGDDEPPAVGHVDQGPVVGAQRGPGVARHHAGGPDQAPVAATGEELAPQARPTKLPRRTRSNLR